MSQGKNRRLGRLDIQKNKKQLAALQNFIDFLLMILFLSLLLLLSPFLYVFSSLGLFRDKKLLIEIKDEFLTPNEGKTFFVYTNRSDNETYINDNLLHFIKPDIELIKLKGKTPFSRFPEKYISYILHNVDEIGFPAFLKVFNGKIYDVSLHKDFYKAKAKKLTGDSLNKIIEDALIRLDSKINHHKDNWQ